MPPKVPKDYVKQHLIERGVNTDSLSPDLIEALNGFSRDEYKTTKVMDQLGAALMSDPNPTDKKLSALH